MSEQNLKHLTTWARRAALVIAFLQKTQPLPSHRSNAHINRNTVEWAVRMLAKATKTEPEQLKPLVEAAVIEQMRAINRRADIADDLNRDGMYSEMGATVLDAFRMDEMCSVPQYDACHVVDDPKEDIQNAISNWVAKKKFGVYVITAPTGCGKTQAIIKLAEKHKVVIAISRVAARKEKANYAKVAGLQAVEMLREKDKVNAKEDFFMFVGYNFAATTFAKLKCLGNSKTKLQLDPPDVLVLDEFPEGDAETVTSAAEICKDLNIPLVLLSAGLSVVPDELEAYYLRIIQGAGEDTETTTKAPRKPKMKLVSLGDGCLFRLVAQFSEKGTPVLGLCSKKEGVLVEKAGGVFFKRGSSVEAFRQAVADKKVVFMTNVFNSALDVFAGHSEDIIYVATQKMFRQCGGTCVKQLLGRVRDHLGKNKTLYLIGASVQALAFRQVVPFCACRLPRQLTTSNGFQVMAPVSQLVAELSVRSDLSIDYDVSEYNYVENKKEGDKVRDLYSLYLPLEPGTEPPRTFEQALVEHLAKGKPARVNETAELTLYRNKKNSISVCETKELLCRAQYIERLGLQPAWIEQSDLLFAVVKSAPLNGTNAYQQFLMERFVQAYKAVEGKLCISEKDAISGDKPETRKEQYEMTATDTELIFQEIHSGVILKLPDPAGAFKRAGWNESRPPIVPMAPDLTRVCNEYNYQAAYRAKNQERLKRLQDALENCYRITHKDKHLHRLTKREAERDAATLGVTGIEAVRTRQSPTLFDAGFLTKQEMRIHRQLKGK